MIFIGRTLWPAGKLAQVLAASFGLAACAQFSGDGGMSFVAAGVEHELKKDVAAIRTPEEALAVRAVIEQLLRRPLSADAAVQMALLNNRGLQAAYADLAIAEARRVGESLPPNPIVSLSRISGPLEIEIEKQVVANILALATLPLRSEIAAARFRLAQQRAILETLRVAAETLRAYYRAVGSRELVGFLTQAQQAAETSTSFAVRLGETGAMNKLDQAREQVFYAELTAQLATARQRATSEREALTRHLGLWGNDLDFRLPTALPALPARTQNLPMVEVEAVTRRVDLKMLRMELDALTTLYGLTLASRFVNIFEAGYLESLTKEKEHGERIRNRGFEIELQIPIFDFGEVRVREAEATYMAIVNRMLELAVNVRSEARNAYRVYRSTYDIARHYAREVLPLRKIISDESQLRYNAMLVDVFSLLAEARQRIVATTAAIEAKREFWLASTNLGAAVVGGGSGGGPSTESIQTSAAGTSPAAH
jgi:outer membrane protein TolC